MISNYLLEDGSSDHDFHNNPRTIFDFYLISLDCEDYI